MATTSVPIPVLGTLGFVAPAETAILAGVQADINAAFGGNLNPSPATPQGQLASSQTAIIGNCYSLFLLFCNLVDPALSTGRMQDAIGRIYFISRAPATSTVVTATCTGLPGVIIPVNARAADVFGNIYLCTQAGTIPAGGAISLSFAAQNTGPLACAAGALNIIYQGIPGWDAITNIAAGVQGRAVETATAFETRRALSVAHNSVGSVPSVRGAILTVSGVIDAYVTDNSTASSVTVGGVTLAQNSIYACVLGGLASDVAFAIWSHKAPGCLYNGNTTVTVLDKSAGYLPPYPSYTVIFQRPSVLTIIMSVNIANSGITPSDAVTQIQTAIVGAFAGLDGGVPVKIGYPVFASRYYSAIAKLGSWASQVISILIGSSNAPSASFVGSISGAILTVSSVSFGALAIGQSLIDAAGLILPGTSITALGTGSGGAGTYTMSVSQTTLSSSMSSVTANIYETFVNLDQIAGISPNNISVTLT